MINLRLLYYRDYYIIVVMTVVKMWLERWRTSAGWEVLPTFKLGVLLFSRKQ